MEDGSRAVPYFRDPVSIFDRNVARLSSVISRAGGWRGEQRRLAFGSGATVPEDVRYKEADAGAEEEFAADARGAESSGRVSLLDPWKYVSP